MRGLRVGGMGQGTVLAQQTDAIEPRGEIRSRVGGLGVAQSDESAQPADGVGIQVPYVEVGTERLIEPLVGRVADEASFLLGRAPVIARPNPHISLPAALDPHPHRLVEARRLVDPQRQHPAFVEAIQARDATWRDWVKRDKTGFRADLLIRGGRRGLGCGGPLLDSRLSC